jgi:signal transduction histidine kinase
LDDLLDVRHVMRRVGSLAEPVDLAQLVSDVAADLVIDDHLLDVDLRVPECLADRIGLKHIVGNLVSNALEQSDEGQVVTVRSFPDQARPGMTTIAVEDRGPGVPDDRKQSLFLPSLDDIRDGIGLAIVSALTQLERGQLWVTDRPGGGASFRVSLPNRPAVSTAPRADEKQPQLVRSDDSLAVD